MKREILYRGKRTDGKGWALGVAFPYQRDDGDERAVIIQQFAPLSKSVDCVPVDPSTVGQYTGLTDKNGKRIFEGDVVEYMGVGWEEPEVTRAEVIWCGDDGGWGSTEGQDYWPVELTAADAERMTVVGNIHDNPELLNHETTTRNGG